MSVLLPALVVAAATCSSSPRSSRRVRNKKRAPSASRRSSAPQSRIILTMDRPWPAATAGAGASTPRCTFTARRFASLRDQIAAQLPDHAVAFDVVFESAGKRVDWHGDYESLGPFAFDGVQSIRNHDFVSVHFNLTADGGSLSTLDWPLVSTLHHFVIVKWGIYLCGKADAAPETMSRRCRRAPEL